MSNLLEKIFKESKQASGDMQRLTSDQRSKILMNISGFLQINIPKIIKANSLDIENAKKNNIPAILEINTSDKKATEYLIKAIKSI